MISPPLDSPEMGWRGKMPTNAKPLTEAAIMAWIETGALRAYGYPTKAERVQRIYGVAGGIAALLILAAVFFYPMWR